MVERVQQQMFVLALQLSASIYRVATRPQASIVLCGRPEYTYENNADRAKWFVEGLRILIRRCRPLRPVFEGHR